MVIVEFFCETPIDNMISALANAPDRVVFVGDYKKMRRYDGAFTRFLEAVGNTKTQLEYRSVKSRELSDIVQTLEEIVEDHPGCHFDITGGEPMTMAAIGVIYERYRDRGIELHQYNVRTGKVYDCDLDGKVASGEIPGLTVEQNIILHGGSIVSSDMRSSGTYPWRMDEAFERDVEAMWAICRTNCTEWNRQITQLDALSSYNEGKDPLTISVKMSSIQNDLSSNGRAPDLKTVYDKLRKAGLLTAWEVSSDRFFLRFKNEQVMRCLTKAGTVLELMTCITARRVRKKDGAPLYQSVMTGVFIDWDGIVHEEFAQEVDTENEVDAVLMNGAVPVFISCKNGSVQEDELYKLNTVSDRFGGAYVKKVLVATTLGKGGRGKRYFLERAKDMGIIVIEGVHKMKDGAFEKALRALV